MKALMKGTSCLLSVLLMFSLIIVAFSPLVAHAETFSNVSEFPDFDMDCYVADLFTTEGHSLNNGIEIELNSESTNKIMKNSIESDALLMGSMTAWQVATFEVSDVTSDSVTELGYYESIILSSINTAMKSSRVKDIFDNAVIKDGKMLFNSFKDILKSEYFITDFSLDTYNSLSAENQSAYIKSFGEAFEKQYPKLDKTSDALKIFSTVVKTAKSFEECMNNYAAYSLCSLTNKHLTKVINDLYEQCPVEKVTLKAALLNISSACTSIELAISADALDAIYRGVDIIFGVLTDGWVTKIISAHPAGLALMLGRAVGKTVSNILFSADAICENYYKMCCYDEFEKLVRSVTRYEMNTYTENKTNDNANNMFWAIRLMFNINEVGCDLSIDYAKTIYEKSVAGIFLDKTEYENYKKTIEIIREGKQREYGSLMTSYIFYLEEDYPEIYAAYMKLTGGIENPVVHTTGISFTKKHMTLGLADDMFYFWNNAEVSPANASNRAVNYTSSDESVVSIKPGNALMIVLHQTGTVTITATSEDGGFTDILTIDVVEGHGTDGIHLEDPVTNITESGKCGNNAYYNLYKDGMLKIYGNGTMWNYGLRNSAPWKNLSVKQAVIENGVTSISEYAFYNCTELTSVITPNSITSIGKSAFCGCKGLTSVTIPYGVTSIESNMFNGCKELKSITIPNNVTSIGNYAFDHCTGLTNINIPNSATSIGSGAFEYCNGLTSITIPNSVVSIGDYAFYGCTGLTSITISNNVTNIGKYAFRICTSLTSIIIPDSVTSISSFTFEDCTGLTSVTIPNSVTSIGSHAFRGCMGLTRVTFSDSVTTIGDFAFEHCKRLTSVSIPDSVTSIGDNALGYYHDAGSNRKLEFFTIYGTKGSIAEKYANDNGFVFEAVSANPSSITGDCTWSLDNNGTLTISGNGAMADYSGNESDIPWKDLEVKSIIIADGVTKIGNSAFLGINNLQSVTIPSSVENIGDYAFALCSNLKDVTLTDGLKHIGEGAFENCPQMNTITIPDSVTEIKEFALGYVVDLSNGEVNKNDEFTINYNMSNVAEQYAINNGFYHSHFLNSEIGDINGDGNITIGDVTEIQRHLAELIHFPDEQLVLADTNGDGKVDINDATHLQKYLAEFDGIILGKQS